ncbi:MAG TPA: hypothetical protein VGF94_28895 [Kofleriaceae bacterium]
MKGATMLWGAVLICAVAAAARADSPRAAAAEARIRGQVATANQQLAVAQLDRDAVKADCIRRNRALLDQLAASVSESAASLARTTDAETQRKLLARITFLAAESDRATRDIGQCAGTRRVTIAQAESGAAGDSATPPPPPPPPPAPPEQKPAPKYHYNPFSDCNILGIWSCVTAPIEYDSFASPSK